MSQEKLKVGQPIFFKPIGNLARGNSKKEIISAKIATIGKKYFTVKDVSDGYIHDEEKFYIDTLLQHSGQYQADYQGYLSKQAILDEDEHELLLDFISTKFERSGRLNVTLIQCRAIAQILKS